MKTFTTYQIAQMLGVDITTVIDWIDHGKLEAYKTPGGHRRVEKDNLIEFLRRYEMPIPDVILAEEPELVSNAKRILIVDDDIEVLNFITQAIKKFYKDVEIESAVEGFIAGRLISEFRPDLLILDIRLPGMNGIEVLKHLDKSEHTMKILAITAYPSKKTKEEIIKAGADDYLAKPFGIEELMKKIELLSGKK